MRGRRSRPVVLVVDDDPGIRQTLELVLEDEYEVCDAADARTALAIARSGPIDVVLLDILMPEMDGLAMLEELHGVRPGLPVVVLSALDRASTAATAMRLGAVDYLTKPFDDRVLVDVLAAAVRRKGMVERHPGARPLALLVGCEAPTVAGVAAALSGHVDVQSHPELPPDPAFLNGTRPAALVLEAKGRRVDWLPRATLILEYFAPVPAVVLLDGMRADEARFGCGGRHVMLERPVELTAVLEGICAVLPTALPRRPWSDDRTAAVINAVSDDCAGFDVRAMTNRLGVSPRHLARSFMKHSGMSIGTYLGTVRVHTAALLLRHTDTKMDAVASAVGFHDASHLSRAFVRFTGRRPGHFRVGA